MKLNTLRMRPEPEDEPPPGDDQGPAISMTRTFLLVLFLHVLVIGGALTYHWQKTGTSWHSVRDRIVASLACPDHPVPSSQPPADDPPQSRLTASDIVSIIQTISDRLDAIDARLDRIETDLNKPRARAGPKAPKLRRPPVRDDPDENPPLPPADPELIRLAAPKDI